MAIPQKGSRKIVIDKESYRWLIRKKATYSQTDYGIGFLHVAIEFFENPGTTLIIYTDRKHPKDVETDIINSITPHDIKLWIKQAKQIGWSPSVKGSQFSVKIENGYMKNTTDKY